MFNGGGVPEQIHRFISSPPRPPPPPPHPFHQPAAAERSTSFPVSFTSFDINHHQPQNMLSHDDSRKIIHHRHHHHQHDIKDGVAAAEWIGHTDHDDDNHHHHHHPWCSDEVLALLRFRSTVENWFPEFTWEHTSRKLAEVGFKRSPQECKEKFEEEERMYFNSNHNTNDHHHHINNYNNKGTYRMFSEVDEFYHHGNDNEHASTELRDDQNKRSILTKGNGIVEERGQALLEEDKRDQDQGQVEEASMENKISNTMDDGQVRNVEDEANKSSSSSLMIMREKKKRKRKKRNERFGVLKGFCEGLVRNMIAQQEEMHKKLLEDMVKKEEEKIAREEGWKKQEMERLNKEVEIRAQEQAMVNDRNTNIIKFISKFTNHDHDDGNHKVQSPSHSQNSSSLTLPQSTQGSSRKLQTPPSPLPKTLTPQNPLTSLLHNDKTLEPISTKTLKTKTQNPKPPKSGESFDLGKRWPKDEVLALINTRRNINSMNEDDPHKDGISLSSPSPSSSSSKSVPLWERISKKMLEIGYKRSAKRCKEKWENINKYFRKTKDVNKKRPLDSRTCPYFHQLTALYNQPSTGTITTRPDEDRVGSGDTDHILEVMHVDADDDDGAGEKRSVQFSGFDLEF